MTSRLMVFIDGSNFLRTLSKEIESGFRADKPPDPAIYLANLIVRGLTTRLAGEADFCDSKLLRKYWFGSVQGSEETELELKTLLRGVGFEPVIYRNKKGREKRVDLAICREMLINAFNRNYDLAVLVAGDEDYVDLVGDIKRLGARVIVAFFKRDLSTSLKLAGDNFHEVKVWGEGRQALVNELEGTLPKY